MADKAFQADAFQQDAFQVPYTRATTRAGGMTMGFSRVRAQSRSESRSGTQTDAMIRVYYRGRSYSQSGSIAMTASRSLQAARRFTGRAGGMTAAMSFTMGVVGRNLGRVGLLDDSASSSHIARRLQSRTGTLVAVFTQGHYPRLLMSRAGAMTAVMVQYKALEHAAGFARAVRTGFQADAFQQDAFQVETRAMSASFLKIFGRVFTYVGTRGVDPVAFQPDAFQHDAFQWGNSYVEVVSRRVINGRRVTRAGAMTSAMTRSSLYQRSLSRLGSFASQAMRATAYARVITRAGATMSVVSRRHIAGRVFSRIGTVATAVRRQVTYARGFYRIGVLTVLFRKLRSMNYTPISLSASYRQQIDANASYTPTLALEAKRDEPLPLEANE